jgi:hypothetical protein
MSKPATLPANAGIPTPQEDDLRDVILDATRPATATEPAKTVSSVNWKAFEQARLNPAELICNTYPGMHSGPFDISCHSRVRLNVDSIKAHILARHGTKLGCGYSLRLKQSDGRVWKGWKALAESDVEVVDFRCEVCDENVRFLPQNILHHMRMHSGKTRKLQKGELFNITLTCNMPAEVSEDEADLYDEQ